jgi:lysophospholipase L1-like esterase
MVKRAAMRSRRLLAFTLYAAFGGLFVGLLLFEVGLRIAGFTYDTMPRVVQVRWPTLNQTYEPDRELLWVPHSYQATLLEARRQPPDVIFMGDSCTEFGTYPETTMTLLSKQAPGLARGIKVGVGGWSSQQGLWQLERDVVPLRPKVVTLYYGWNDHWVAMGPLDKDSQPGLVRYWMSRHLRLAQLLAMVEVTMQIKNDDHPPKRVDLDSYRANLTKMVERIRSSGGVPVLITAASNHIPGKEPRPLGIRSLRDLSELVPLHRSYVAATREVATRTGAYLCDAFAAFDPDPNRATYFKDDGIHLTPEGDQHLAELVAGCIVKATAHP